MQPTHREFRYVESNSTRSHFMATCLGQFALQCLQEI